MFMKGTLPHFSTGWGAVPSHNNKMVVAANKKTHRRRREQLILILFIAIATCIPYAATRFNPDILDSIRDENTGIGVGEAKPNKDEQRTGSSGTASDTTQLINRKENIRTSTSDSLLQDTVQQKHSYSCTAPADTAGTFLSRIEARNIISKMSVEKLQENRTLRLVPVANALLESAQALNNTLLTVQVGGMDGKTGDPMYRMTTFFESLANWLPVVFEPVAFNYGNLQQTYQRHQQQKQLICPLLLHQAISYKNTTDDTCPFCHLDKDRNGCTDLPDWQKFEIGSLDCAFFELKFPDCYVQDHIPCDTIVSTLTKWKLDTGAVGILQLDVEGHETQLLHGLFSEIDSTPELYPPVINFEAKVLRTRGQLPAISKMLQERGYVMHHKRIDAMALLVN